MKVTVIVEDDGHYDRAYTRVIAGKGAEELNASLLSAGLEDISDNIIHAICDKAQQQGNIPITDKEHECLLRKIMIKDLNIIGTLKLNRNESN